MYLLITMYLSQVSFHSGQNRNLQGELPQYCSVNERYPSRQAGGAGGAGEEKTALSEQYWELPSLQRSQREKVNSKTPPWLVGRGEYAEDKGKKLFNWMFA
ncbi:MAG: hypothetical protein LDL41_09545 [Coleofasciculus sp. S288]|nr:hypothetical protein [Coleofasciculus sp. S288]